MRGWIRYWLGVEQLEDRLDTKSTDLREAKADVANLLLRVYQLEESNKKIAEVLRGPVDFRLAQLKSGADILTRFSNELQKDIEKVAEKE